MIKRILFFLILVCIFNERYFYAKDFIYHDVIDDNGKQIVYKDMNEVKITISLEKRKSKLRVTILNVSKSAVIFSNEDFTSFVIFNAVTLESCMQAIERYTFASELKAVIQPSRSISYYLDIKKLIDSCSIDINKKENKLLSLSLRYSINQKSIHSNNLEIEF